MRSKRTDNVNISQKNGTISIQLIENWEDIIGLKRDWNALLEKSGSDSIFLTFEWLECWIVALGKGARPFVVTLRDADEVKAIAPMIIVKHLEYGCSLRRLQFLGSPESDYADFIVIGDRQSYLEKIFGFILEHKAEWDYVRLLHITDESPNWLPLQNTLNSYNLDFIVTKHSVCPYVSLDMSINEYMRSRPKALSYDIRRGKQRLCEIGSFIYEVLCKPHDSIAALPEFLRMLQRREISAARAAKISPEERLKKFCTSLIESKTMNSFVHFSRLSLNGQAFAYHFGFAYRGKMYWYKPTFDPAYSKYSPGKIIIKYAMDEAINNGFREFDFLLGDEPYKFQWTDNVRVSYNVDVYKSCVKSKLVRLWFNTIKPKIKSSKITIDIVNRTRNR